MIVSSKGRIYALILTPAPGVPLYRWKLRPCEFQLIHLEPRAEDLPHMPRCLLAGQWGLSTSKAVVTTASTYSMLMLRALCVCELV